MLNASGPVPGVREPDRISKWDRYERLQHPRKVPSCWGLAVVLAAAAVISTCLLAVASAMADSLLSRHDHFFVSNDFGHFDDTYTYWCMTVRSNSSVAFSLSIQCIQNTRVQVQFLNLLTSKIENGLIKVNQAPKIENRAIKVKFGVTWRFIGGFLRGHKSQFLGLNFRG